MAIISADTIDDTAAKKTGKQGAEKAEIQSVEKIANKTSKYRVEI